MNIEKKQGIIRNKMGSGRSDTGGVGKGSRYD